MDTQYEWKKLYKGHISLVTLQHEDLVVKQVQTQWMFTVKTIFKTKRKKWL